MIDLKRKEKEKYAETGSEYSAPEYPCAYISNLEDSSFKNLALGQEVTIKGKIVSISHKESEKDDSNSLEIELTSMNPGGRVKEFGSRKPVEEADDTKSAFEKFKKSKNKPSEPEEDEEYESE